MPKSASQLGGGLTDTLVSAGPKERGGFRIETATPGDAEAIAKLKDAHGREGSVWLKRFRWQFLDNPAYDADRPIGWVVRTSEGEVLGHEMAMPQRFRLFGTEKTIAISSDTFVDPQLRGMGLGKDLFDAYFKARRGGVALGTSSNDATQHLWEKVGGFPIGNLNVIYRLPFRSHAVAVAEGGDSKSRSSLFKSANYVMGRILDAVARRELPTLAKSTRCASVEPEAEVLDELWIRYGNDYPVTAVRDRTYRSWRYSQAPPPTPQVYLVEGRGDSGDDVRGWFVIRVVRRGRLTVVCELLDVFGPLRDREFQRQVLISAVQVGAESGADMLEVQGMHPGWRAHMAGLGFLSVKLASDPFMCRNMGSFDEDALRLPTSWHVCAADGDAAV